MNKNILLPLMGLNIGGAETHVLELALELKRQGFNVVLASSGGVYEKELLAAGIPHRSVPLNTRNVFKMIQSYFKLKRIVKEENIDLIHAHGRIPAFVSGFVHKSTKVPFMTTAHWVFKTEGGLRYLTDWGQKCISVSEDIKDYLIREYKYPEKDIYTTINGIDTNKFSPDIGYLDVLREFKIPENSFKIVYISRMDEDRAKVAFDLVCAAEKLSPLIPDLQIIIVGGGNVFSKLAERAALANSKIGRDVITLTGGRTDINKFTAMADIFIAVSRSALEAMSAKKPVIVAGNEGYIGIFDESKLPVSIETNFCCRGCPMPTEQMLLSDITDIFRMSAEKRLALGSYARSIIEERYSVLKMARDNIEVYKLLFNPYEYDALISGYYGFKNSGDDALLLSVINSLKQQRPGIRLCVLSKTPKETSKVYGVDSINRYNYFRIKDIMKKTKLLISGGGSLIQDITSTQSIIYYTFVIRMAQRLGLKTMLYSNGIGPVNKSFNKLMARNVLNKVDVITLRDEGSKKVLDALKITKPQIVLASDPALTLSPQPNIDIKTLYRMNKLNTDTQYFGISVRPWHNTPAKFKEMMAKTADYVNEKYGITPVFVPMKYPDDLTYSKEVLALCRQKYPVITKQLPVESLIRLFGTFQMMLAMRLHSIIYSSSMAIPTVGIAYDPKIRSFMYETGQLSYLNIETLKEDALLSVIDKTIENHEQISYELMVNINKMKARSGISDRLALELIDEKS